MSSVNSLSLSLSLSLSPTSPYFATHVLLNLPIISFFFHIQILERSGVQQQSNPLAALSNILRKGSSGRGSFKGSKSPKKSLPESPRTTPKPKKRTSLDTPESPFRLGSEPPKSQKGFLKGLRRSSSKSKKKTNGVNESSEDLASETSSITSLPVHGSVKDDSMETGASAVGTVSPAKSADLSMNGDMESTDQGPSSSSPVASAKAQDLSVSPIKGGTSPSFISPVHHTNRDSACFKETSFEPLFGSNSNLFDTSELDTLFGREKRNKTPEKVLDEKDKSTSAMKHERAKTPDSTVLGSKKPVGVGVAAAHLRANRPASASSADNAGIKARLKMYEANYKASSTASKEEEKEKEPEAPGLSSTPKTSSKDAPEKKSSLLFEDEGEDDLFAVSASSKKDDKQAIESMDVDKKKASLFDDELFQEKEKEAPKPVPKVAPKVAPKIAPKIAPKSAKRGLTDSPKRGARGTTPPSVVTDRGDSPARIGSPKRESSLSPVRTASPSKKAKSPSPTPMEEDRVKSPKPADLATTKARASKEPSPVSPTPSIEKEEEKEEVKMEVETAESAAKSSDIFGPPLDNVGKPKAEEKKTTNKSRGLFDEDESVGLFSSPSSRKRGAASAGDQKSGKLFDNDDLFSEKKTTKKSGGLFDDDEEESPLFSTKKEPKPAAAVEEEEKEKEKESSKTEDKKPARSRGRFDDTPIPVFSAKKRKEREQKEQEEVRGESLTGSDTKSAVPKSSEKGKSSTTSKIFDNIDEGDDLEGIAGAVFDSKKSEAKPPKEERKSTPDEEAMEVDTLVEKTKLEKESEERAKEKRLSKEEKSELFAELKDESEAAPEVKVTSPPTSPPPSNEEKIKEEEKAKEETIEEKPAAKSEGSGSRPSSSRGRVSPRTARSKFETDTKPSSRRGAASDGAKSSSVGKTRTPSGRDAKKGADEGGKPAWMVEIQKRRESKKDEKAGSSTPASRKEASSAAGKDTKEMPEWQKRALERKKKAEAEKASARSARLEKSPRLGRKSDTGTSSPTAGTKSPSSGRRSAEMKKSDSTETGTRSPRRRYGRNAEDKAKSDETSSRVKSARADSKDKEEKASSEEKPKLTKKPSIEVTVKKTSGKVEEGTTEKEKEEETRKSVSSEPDEKEKEEEKTQESTKESKPVETEEKQQGDDEFTDSGKPEEEEEKAVEKKESSTVEQTDSPKHTIEIVSLVDSEKDVVSSTESAKKSVSEEDKDSEASKKSSRTTSPLPDKSPSRSSSRQSNASSSDTETRAFRSHTMSSPRSPTPTGSGSSYSGLPKTSADDSIPEWKKKLLEKKKSGPTTPTRTKAATKEPEIPAWKKELMAKRANKPEDKVGGWVGGWVSVCVWVWGVCGCVYVHECMLVLTLV